MGSLVFLFIFSLSVIFCSTLVSGQSFDCGCLQSSTVRISVIVHSPPDEDLDVAELVAGANSAAKRLQIDNGLKVLSPVAYDVDAFIKLIRQEASLQPEAMIVTIPDSKVIPELAQIPENVLLFTVHAGQQWASDANSRMHIGQNETKAAELVAHKLFEANVSHALFLDTDQSMITEMRHTQIGTFLKELNPESSLNVYHIPGSNVKFAEDEIAKALRLYPDTEMIIYSGARSTITKALKDIKLKNIQLIAYDVNEDLLKEYQGTKLPFFFLIDQQSYGAGFLATTSVYLQLFQASQLALDYIESGPIIIDTKERGLELLNARSQKEKQVKQRFVTHGSLQDSFWVRVGTAVEDAARLFQVEVSSFFTENFDLEQIYNNIVAINDPSNTEDVLLATNASPDDLNEAFMSLTKPSMTLNSGQEAVGVIPIMYHIGQDESLVGIGAGEKFLADNRKFVGCIIHEYGHTGLLMRCKGLKDTMEAQGFTVVELNVDDASDEIFKQELLRALQQYPGIDGLFTLGATYGSLALEVIATDPKYSGITVGTVDVNEQVLMDVYEGRMLFAVDQQEYLQGFIPVVLGYLRIVNLTQFQTLKMNSGPLMLTKNNDLVMKLCLNSGRLNQDCSSGCVNEVDEEESHPVPEKIKGHDGLCVTANETDGTSYVRICVEERKPGSYDALVYAQPGSILVHVCAHNATLTTKGNCTQAAETKAWSCSVPASKGNKSKDRSESEDEQKREKQGKEGKEKKAKPVEFIATAESKNEDFLLQASLDSGLFVVFDSSLVTKWN